MSLCRYLYMEGVFLNLHVAFQRAHETKYILAHRLFSLASFEYLLLIDSNIFIQTSNPSILVGYKEDPEAGSLTMHTWDACAVLQLWGIYGVCWYF